MIVGETLKHGRVEHVAKGSAMVAVDCETPQCGGCKLAPVCSGNREAVILRAKPAYGVTVAVGDEVVLIGRLRGWVLSWLLLAAVPCLLIIGSVIGGYAIGLADVLIGVCTLGVLGLYYLVLWLFRRGIDRRMEWIITGHDCKNPSGKKDSYDFEVL